MKLFPPHLTDFYKTGHKFQYPPGTEYVYSNFTCRSDKFASVLSDFDHKVVFFGLQGVCQWLLRDLWNQEFFSKPETGVVDRYRRMMKNALGVDMDVSHIRDLHRLGYLPLLIKALPEGSRVDMRVPMFTIVNTLPEFYWVTNYVETQLSAELWKSMTSATTAFEYWRLLNRYAEFTDAPKDFIRWQGHDFSFRGMSGITDAAQSGAGHLLSFCGTDTIPAIDYLEDYYLGGVEGVIGGSVPATEHSVMCMGGAEDEIETFRRLICDVYPDGIVSIVSDTWDFWQVITKYAVELRDMIMNRNGKVVFRPDSGDPVKIIVGDPEAKEGHPASKGAAECLWEVFGGTQTASGYRTLDSHVGLIYGDSITLDRAERILAGLQAKNFSSANIVFGIGSYTYQHVTRDSFGSAIKATWGQVHGQERELYKEPKTDNGIKKSARGLLRVEEQAGGFILCDRQTHEGEASGALRPVFRDGMMVRLETLGEIRRRLGTFV